MTTQSLDAQGKIQGMQNLFEEDTVKAVIKKVNPQKALGPSGLRYRYLQTGLSDELLEDIAVFVTLAILSRCLSQPFRTMHTSANLSALGQKARPVACGDVLQRITSTIFCPLYGRNLAD